MLKLNKRGGKMHIENTNAPLARGGCENGIRQLNRNNSSGQSQYRFDRSALPPAQSFYASEGFTLARANGRGWAMAKGQPPCHKSTSGRSFSLNVTHGGFKCFGCGTQGDMVKFVMIRDCCDFKTAAKTLGAWRGNITGEQRLEIIRREQEREWHRQREEQRKESERRTRVALADELHTTVRLYRTVGGELQRLGPGAEDQWATLPFLLDDWRITESDYCRAAGLDNPYE